MTFLDDVVGHEAVKEDLRRTWSSGRVPTGMLLFGEPGRGKRTLAVAFARVLLCGEEHGLDGPCARRIASGTHPDLLMVQRDEEQRLVGIDRIRALRKALSLTPVEAPRRVAIVVEADRLTEEAGNALLKTLEEPPPESHVFLTARDRDAVMETLVSRCRCLRVPPLSREEVAGFLVSRGVEGPRADRAAALAEGRPGMALRLAEEDFEEHLLAPAVLLLAPGEEPLGSSERVAAAARQGVAKVEGARERLRDVLTTAAGLLRGRLREASGCASRTLEVMPDAVAEAVRHRSFAEAEAGLELVLESLADLDRNVTPELVLDRMVRHPMR